MLPKNYIQHMEEIFLRQFEQDDDRFLYRKHGRGAPIPVTLEEREKFRLQYRKATTRMFWGLTLTLAFAIVLASLIVPEFIDEGPEIVFLSLGAIGAIAALSVHKGTAPARALRHRSPVGDKLSREEVQSRHFDTTSWPLLVSIFLISSVVFVSLLVWSEFGEWSDYFWTAGSAALSILGARALWLKYRLAR